MEIAMGLSLPYFSWTSSLVGFQVLELIALTLMEALPKSLLNVVLEKESHALILYHSEMH